MVSEVTRLLFSRGIHPPGHKDLTRNKTIEELPAPEVLVVPMSMHIGAPCSPLVKVGEQVAMGQLIGENKNALSAPIHAPVSGKVLSVEPRPHPNGLAVMSVVIQNDGLDTLHESVKPYGSLQSLSAEELTAIAYEAGLVGLGGATFPTATKIKSGVGQVDSLIINGAECEPYITSDQRVMCEMPEEVVGGTRALMKIYELREAIIAIESNKPDAYESIKNTLSKADENIRLKWLPTRYPQGAEKQLIKTVLNREVPPGELPAAVGAAVFNVDTVAALHRAITTGLPLMRRIVTVSGSAVSNPKNLKVRLGTPLVKVFEAVGGFKEQPYKVLMGGPMMGVAQFNLDVPVVKATNALLALTASDSTEADGEPVCIRCGRCVHVCPVRLLPVYLYQYERKNMLDQLTRQRVTDCIECGSCSYVCPGRLHLTQSFRTAKQKLRESK